MRTILEERLYDKLEASFEQWRAEGVKPVVAKIRARTLIRESLVDDTARALLNKAALEYVDHLYDDLIGDVK